MLDALYSFYWGCTVHTFRPYHNDKPSAVVIIIY